MIKKYSIFLESRNGIEFDPSTGSFSKPVVKHNAPNIKLFSHNNIIDYTLLEENSTEDEIIVLCRKAISLQVKSVCVLPKFVKVSSDFLKDSSVLVCTVISFPSGSNNIDQKISECQKAISEGADEIDMVMNYNLLKGKTYQTIKSDGTYDILWDEVTKLSNLCHSSNNKESKKIILKVIVESGELSEEETSISTNICISGKADFIKTSTGKTSVGSELNKIKIMYNTIKNSGSSMRIKASGGIKTSSDINQVIDYVDRLGMGFGSVDTLNNLSSGVISDY